MDAGHTAIISQRTHPQVPIQLLKQFKGSFCPSSGWVYQNQLDIAILSDPGLHTVHTN